MLSCKYPPYYLTINLTESSVNTWMMVTYKSATMRNVISLIMPGPGRNNTTGAMDVKASRAISIHIDGAPFYGRWYVLAAERSIDSPSSSLKAGRAIPCERMVKPRRPSTHAHWPDNRFLFSLPTFENFISQSFSLSTILFLHTIVPFGSIPQIVS